MYLMRPYTEVVTPLNAEVIMSHLERCGRVCYKSEDRITADSADAFCRKLRLRKHLPALEHFLVTVKFIVDRGVSHELVRHRLASYCQESTRFCNYGKRGVSFIIPLWCTGIVPGVFKSVSYEDDGELIWGQAMLRAERDYLQLLEIGWRPEQARDVMPVSLKTEVVMSCNVREWMHVFAMRDAVAAHPQMREVMEPLHKTFKAVLPALFGDL